MKKMIKMSWQEYDELANILAKKIDNKIDTIICINRGGLVIGRLLSDILNAPLGVISAKCYGIGDCNANAEAVFQPIISLIGPVGKRVLLVDDLVDTGRTMKKLLKFMQDSYPDSKIRTAVLLKDKDCPIVPDYFVELKDEEDWIVFPYEVNEFKN